MGILSNNNSSVNVVPNEVRMEGREQESYFKFHFTAVLFYSIYVHVRIFTQKKKKNIYTTSTIITCNLFVRTKLKLNGLHFYG